MEKRKYLSVKDLHAQNKLLEEERGEVMAGIPTKQSAAERAVINRKLGVLSLTQAKLRTDTVHVKTRKKRIYFH